MKNLLLNKGWAGRTISRRETYERLDPLLRRQNEMIYTYDAAIARLDDGTARDRLDQFQRVARADASKLSETILNAGGHPSTGTDLEPTDFDPGIGRKEIVAHLRSLEEEMLDAVRGEKKFEHRMHTRAILLNLEKNASERLDYLRSL